jgi:hypothetical protein
MDPRSSPGLNLESALITSLMPSTIFLLTCSWPQCQMHVNRRAHCYSSERLQWLAASCSLPSSSACSWDYCQVCTQMRTAKLTGPSLFCASLMADITCITSSMTCVVGSCATHATEEQGDTVAYCLTLLFSRAGEGDREWCGVYVCERERDQQQAGHWRSHRSYPNQQRTCASHLQELHSSSKPVHQEREQL